MPAAVNTMGTGVRHSYAANDLISYNGTKNAGLVLQVHEDYLKVINEQGKIDSVKVIDIGKKLPPPKRGGTLGGRDMKGNALVHDAMIKCEQGQYKGMIAPIKHSFKNYLFLWHKEFVHANGIFVEHCNNVTIRGDEFMKGDQG
jgi:transcription elongation factor